MDQEKIRAAREAEAQRKKEQALLQDEANQRASIVGAVNQTTDATTKGSAKVKQAVTDGSTKVVQSVNDSGKAVIDTLAANNTNVTDALNNLVLATLVSKDPALIDLTKNIAGLLKELSGAGQDFKDSKLQLLPVANQKLASSIDKLASNITEKPEKDYTPELKEIQKLLGSIDVKPVVNVPQTSVNVDLKPLSKGIAELKSAIQNNKVVIPENDDSAVVEGLQKLQDTISNLRFPVPNFQLPFQTQTGKDTQLKLNDDGTVPTVSLGQLINFNYDYISVAYPDNDTEVYTYKSGGSGGTTVGTITVNYTDSTKDAILDITRS